MSSQWVCLCGVLLSISVQGYNYSYNGWTMSGADIVSTVEGSSAVLPCSFTHPPTEQTLTGTVMWYKIKSGVNKLVFNCTCSDLGSSQYDPATQEVGGGRFTFVGNLSQRDASVMMDRLRREDGAWYRCRVELNIGKIQTVFPITLIVRAPDGKGSVVNGTEGDSVTLPCVFQRPLSDLTLHTITWMVKDPYQLVVTFRRRSDGSWVAESDATRYELIRDPKHGDASTRINQLSVRDNHGYLCLVESRKPAYFYNIKGINGQVKTPYIHLSQCEARLLVSPDYSYNGWTMSGADMVTAVEGESAVLPCSFTHPPMEQTLTGTVMWYKINLGVNQLVFNCTYPDLGPYRCDRATQEVEGGRFRFVGNMSQRDASVMVDHLNREDEAQYRCHVELNIAPDGNCSMVSGTEGDSVTLPCVFKWPLSDLTLHTVTWMVKDPYRHIVTFRQRSGGSWVAESNIEL
ncbi:uncharacterized protein [Narcine bancroftii]|uniref:uncharacterized protein isoform X2 n=1 Tax=Narcine bancroftii TaxID=1343680 RepID=UPI00383118F1